MEQLNTPDLSLRTRRTIGIVGYGFIGRRIARTALLRGDRVVVLNRSPVDTTQGMTVLIGDAADPELMNRFVSDVDSIIYAAGSSKPAESNVDPLAETTRNLAPLLVTLEALRASAVTNFTYLSSAGTIYGPDVEGSATEESANWPISAYGVLKVTAERFISMYTHVHGLHADILRCSNVYGPGQPMDGSQGVIGVFLNAVRAGRSVVVFGDGSATRDFIHVDDLSDVALRLLPSQSGTRVFNVGSGETITIAETLHLIATSIGVEAIVDRRPPRPFDVPDVQLDTTLLRNTIEFAPRCLAEGIAGLVPNLMSR